MNWLARLLFADVYKQLEVVMASLDQVKERIAAEAAQVKQHVDELRAEVQGLKDQIAQGNQVTPEQFDELIAHIDNIFIPEQPTNRSNRIG